MPFLDPEFLKANRYDYSISILQREANMLTSEYVRINSIWKDSQHNKGIREYKTTKRKTDLTIAMENIKLRLQAIEDTIELLQGFNIKEINS